MRAPLEEKLGADNPISHELTFMWHLMDYREAGEDEGRRQQLADEMKAGRGPGLQCSLAAERAGLVRLGRDARGWRRGSSAAAPCAVYAALAARACVSSIRGLRVARRR